MTMEQQMLWQKTIPVRLDTDVLVAGGGPAGIAAAVAAARNGAKVFLVEGLSCLGGSGTSGMVSQLVGLTDGEHFMAGGIGAEMHQRLREMGGFRAYPYSGDILRTEIFKRFCDAYLLENGVSFLLVTRLIDVVREDGRVTAAILHGKSGIFAVTARQFIDCTGDGDLSVMAGAAFELGDENGNMQPGTLCSQWTGVDWSQADRRFQDEAMERAIADGFFTVPDHHFPGGYQNGETTMTLNAGHAHGLDGTDERSLTDAYITQRRRVVEYGEFYRKYLDGFSRIDLTATAPLMGVRESRRILGEYQMTERDFLERAVFADEIGRFAYAVDRHRNATDPEEYRRFEQQFQDLRYGPGESYGIPLRALLVKGLENVTVAGRCISADCSMQASVRVMPGCFITGQAAGTAAALAVRKGVQLRHVPVREIQAALKDMGAYLPNVRPE